MKYKTKKVIDCQDWDDLVKKTYGKPYCFQQQDGCQERGIYTINIPDESLEEEDMHDFIPEKVNGDKMGVKFNVWLARDPKDPLHNPDDQNSWSINMFWERNFYPNIQTLANDLHKKGLIKAGEYHIDIDW